MENRAYYVAESASKYAGYYVGAYRTGDATATELRSVGIEVFAEDLTHDEATALVKLMNYERG